MLKAVYDSLLAIVYPQACHLCENSVENSDDGVVCGSCWRATKIFTGREILCAKCGAYLRQSRAETIETFCHRCDEHFYDAAKAVGIYDKALAASIVYLKRTPAVSKKLRELFLAAFDKANFHDTDLIVPVPLSRRRFYERGYNQAEVLGELLAKKFKIAVDAKSLTRQRHTPVHRAAMDQKARELTVKNAFELTRVNLVKNKNILLIDDVLTSGATASTCAKALKKAGADKVYVLTIARAK